MLSSVLGRLPIRVTDSVGLILRVLRSVGRATALDPLPTDGRCASCNRESWFLRCRNPGLAERIRRWPYEKSVLTALVTRENYFCLWCGRNYRMRGLASVARRWISNARVYEPASFGVFAGATRRLATTYQTSEYLPAAPRGSVVNGLRHEDIMALTFPDACFDVVITSELFEHVTDPWAGFREVRRVLRLGGHHIFTVPTVPATLTASRSQLPAVYHIDPRRPEGIAVITDFGEDLAELLGPLGFETEVHLLPPAAPLLRVYESRAV